MEVVLQQSPVVMASYATQETAIAQPLPETQNSDVAQPTQTAVSVPERTGPPDTVSSMKTGYVVALAIFLGYIVLLMRRVASVRRTS